ncbi:MAG TPA: FAD-binding oxidoreductase [Nocardioidaceae bacterium]|nr:FAD-binding oxidoreductase [Nocardioidaceae bacterium]
MSSGRDESAATADAVVVGGGILGGWCAWFLSRSGLRHVVLVESDRLGQGSSSRAAGVVRTQGGTPWTVQLGVWSRDFYRHQRDGLGIDSGFVTQPYFLPCFTEAEVDATRKRISMEQRLGLDVRWVDPEEADRLNPTMTPGTTLGGSYCETDGFISPPRNVAAYTAALVAAGVDVREGTDFTGLRLVGGRMTGVETSAGFVATERVVLTGGPKLAAVGRLAGVRIPAGGVRHQIAVTEQDARFAPDRLPMVFDVPSGLYWRPEEGGLLFGMSNPDEPPGTVRTIDEPYLAKMRQRLGELVPSTVGVGLRRVWAATIDFTPDHLPIVGPATGVDGRIEGVTVAAAGGAGMMWGPAIARAAADIALTGTTQVIDDAAALGLDRFDESGHSRLAPENVALPFPSRPERSASA